MVHGNDGSANKGRLWRTALLTGILLSALEPHAEAKNGCPAPSDEQVATAARVSDLMLNELLAALFTEFDETTASNADEGKQAISLIFDDANRNMRLVGTFGPLLGGHNDRPADGFERAALAQALTGSATTSVERGDGSWVYRRSVPLSNTFHESCVLCHSNFTPEFFERTNNPGEWVGALFLSVPIASARSCR